MNAALIVAAFAMVWVAVVVLWVGAIALLAWVREDPTEGDDRSRGLWADWPSEDMRAE